MRSQERAIVVENRALSDEDVVERVLAGERELFELILRRHNNQRLFGAIASSRP